MTSLAMNEVANRFRELRRHKRRFQDEAIDIRKLFKGDRQRFSNFSLNALGLLLDYSRNQLDGPAMDALLGLACAARVEQQRNAMFAGERVNFSEDRPALHHVLRCFSGHKLMVDGENITIKVEKARQKIKSLSEAIRTGHLVGSTGKRFKHVVNLGVGGAGLGPAMVSQALSPYADDFLSMYFASNIDPAHLGEILGKIDPEATLFIVSSKSFTTQETMINAAWARNFMERHLEGEGFKHHFVALTANAARALDFGLRADRVLPIWDWVGGRFSVWSAVGLPIAIAIGYDNFEQFLKGGEEMDNHFTTAPLEDNLPIILALLGIWQRNIWDRPALAILPYDQNLAQFPAYLQQLEMESNGKQTRRDGNFSEVATVPIIWGDVGSNSQHAFYQFLHQGSDIIPIDVLVAAKSHYDQRQHNMLVANCLAQAAAFAYGRDATESYRLLLSEGLARDEALMQMNSRTFPGNRPSNLLIYQILDPKTLGKLIALYEHKVFVQGAIWGLNSFDQWGVEFGKQLALKLTGGGDAPRALSVVEGARSHIIELQHKQ